MRGLETRPAVAGDYDFAYKLHKQAFRSYVEQIWGWDEAWQQDHFRDEYDQALTEIIVYRGEDIGFMRVEDHGDHLFLDVIVIRPAFQRRGLGTALLGRVLDEAEEQELPLRLSVLQINPARVLYERLGFRVTGGDEHRFYMEAMPDK